MPARTDAIPYWRLSNFYFVYFASLGALVPYWGLYLQSLGLSVVEIGKLMAIIYATKIVSPSVWGWIADRTGKRMAIVRIACLLGALLFVGVFWASSFFSLAVVMSLFSFFWNASLPQFEATTMTHLGKGSHRYSSIRLWGSIGFIVTAWGLGYLIQDFGAGILPGVLMALFVLIWLSSYSVPEQAAGHLSLHHEPLRSVLRKPVVIALLAVCFLMQLSHGPYYSFYTIYLDEHGYSADAIGALWGLAVLAEVGLFLLMQRLLARFNPRFLLLTSFLLSTVRWFLIAAFPDAVAVIMVAQILHAASFGLYHAVAIHLVHRYFRGRNQGIGQGLYSSVSFGAGGAVGSLVSGYIWTLAGSNWVYWMAMVVTMIAFVLTWCFLREEFQSGELVDRVE